MFMADLKRWLVLKQFALSAAESVPSEPKPQNLLNPARKFGAEGPFEAEICFRFRRY
jgi:hypothetical protein